MSEFFESIIILSVISGIVSSLLSSSGTIKKYVSYFISLIMILIFLTPVFNILSSFNKIGEYMENFKHSIKTEEIIEKSNRLIINSGEESICNGIKELIVSKFNFEKSDVYVYLNCDKSNVNSIKINSIDVVLTNKASWSDTENVKEYLDKTVGCEINVTRR